MRIAIITGASSGMGAEFVRQCAAGYPGLDEIWTLSRRKERLEMQRAEIEQTFGENAPKIRPLAVDITDPAQREFVWRTLRENNPQVMLLVNSAGVGKKGMFGSETCEKETDMVRVNCEALVAMTYGVLPFLFPKSHIIQMASAAAFSPQPGFAVYAATKAFVYSFSRALAKELAGRKIRVTTVCPGPVNTEFLAAAGSGKLEWYRRLVIAQPQPVVKKALRDAAKGKQESIFGLAMRGCKAAGKLLPWSLLMLFCRSQSGMHHKAGKDSI